jgi:hypothetical protein
MSTEYLSPDVTQYNATAREIVRTFAAARTEAQWNALRRGNPKGYAKAIAEVWSRLTEQAPAWKLNNALGFAPIDAGPEAVAVFGLAPTAPISRVREAIEAALSSINRPSY